VVSEVLKKFGVFILKVQAVLLILLLVLGLFNPKTLNLPHETSSTAHSATLSNIPEEFKPKQRLPDNLKSF
jgi:hypothetical protein